MSTTVAHFRNVLLRKLAIHHAKRHMSLKALPCTEITDQADVIYQRLKPESLPKRKSSRARVVPEWLCFSSLKCCAYAKDSATAETLSMTYVARTAALITSQVVRIAKSKNFGVRNLIPMGISSMPQLVAGCVAYAGAHTPSHVFNILPTRACP